MEQFGIPTNAGLAQGTKPTFALFRYHDVMEVMRDAETYTSGFIKEGLGAAFDGLFVLGLDGEQHKNVRALLQPAFMPQTVNKWSDRIDALIRRDFIEPMVPDKKANIMDFGLYFPHGFVLVQWEVRHCPPRLRSNNVRTPSIISKRLSNTRCKGCCI